MESGGPWQEPQLKLPHHLKQWDGWFGLVQISNLTLLANVLKMIQRKMLVSFLRPENSAAFKSTFSQRFFYLYVVSVEKTLFLGYEHFLSSRLNQEMSFSAISVLPIMALSHLPASYLFF